MADTPRGEAETVPEVDVPGTTGTVETTASPAIGSASASVLAEPVAGYELGELLGRGGMGEVVAARDPRIEREVALKRVRRGTANAETIARFVREAKIQARLDHPAIVPVHELGRDANGLPYFTMKRLTGETLAARLPASGPLQPLLRALIDACFAIELAHTRGVIHRDLKPSNIMMGDYGEVYVLDWGIARLTDGETYRPSAPQHDVTDSDATAAGAVLGTPGYMPPEQMRGEAIGPAADVYALGAILFEILAGEPLHPLRDTIQSTLGGATVCSPAARAPDRMIAPELDALCVAALATDPAARPTARALATGVQDHLDGVRNMDHRRKAAAEELDRARAAAAAGNLPEAIRAAGRAVALDPEAQAQGTELAMSWVLSPPDQLPAEAERDLAAAERELDRRAGRRGATAFLLVWAILPLALFLPVNNWAALLGLVGAGTAMAGAAILNARGWLPYWALVLCDAVFVVVFSRLSGPFVMTPLVAVAVSIALAERDPRGRYGPPVIVMLLVSALPVALEAIGVLAPTWWVAGGGLVAGGTVFAADGTAEAVATGLGSAALAAVVLLYAQAINRERRVAQRKIHIQAWYLRQLLPPR